MHKMYTRSKGKKRGPKVSTNLYKVHLRVETLLHGLVETQRVVSVTKLEKKYLRLLLFGN